MESCHIPLHNFIDSVDEVMPLQWPPFRTFNPEPMLTDAKQELSLILPLLGNPSTRCQAIVRSPVVLSLH